MIQLTAAVTADPTRMPKSRADERTLIEAAKAEVAALRDWQADRTLPAPSNERLTPPPAPPRFRPVRV